MSMKKSKKTPQKCRLQVEHIVYTFYEFYPFKQYVTAEN
jgi:hypothetical protein